MLFIASSRPGILRAVLLWLLTVALGTVLLFPVLLLMEEANHLINVSELMTLTGLMAGILSFPIIPFAYFLLLWASGLATPTVRWLVALGGVGVLFAALLMLVVVYLFEGSWDGELLRLMLPYLPAAWLATAALYRQWLHQPAASVQAPAA